MRHRKAGIKLGRTTSHRQAMFRNMVTSLFKYDRIRTTDIKAKELRRWADHIITLAKVGDLHARRQVMAIVREKNVVHKLFEEAGKRFGTINGGYTRIVKIGARPGDSAPISLIELVSSDEQQKTKKKAKAGAKQKGPSSATKPAEKEEAPVTAPAESTVEASRSTDSDEKSEAVVSDSVEASAEAPHGDHTEEDVNVPTDVEQGASEKKE